MFRSKIALLLLLISNTCPAQTEPLFPIVQDDKVGYINQKGEIIIAPAFFNGNPFSDGLASVRKNGHYGYINQTGHFVIQPEYDQASDFNNGFALAYKNEKPFIIDKSGKPALPDVFTAIRFIDKNRAVVSTATNKEGLMDMTSKKLIIDTLYSSLDHFKHGLAIATKWLPDSKGKKRKGESLITETGQVVIPFGRFYKINPFSEGYALVSIPNSLNEDIARDGVIDTTGKLLFTRSRENHSYIQEPFKNGLAKVSLYQHWLPEKKGVSYNSEKSYVGFIDTRGKLMLNNPLYTDLTNFSDGRAFAKIGNGYYIMIDRNFKQVGSDQYFIIYSEGFKDGLALVSTDDGTAFIDTNGKILPAPLKHPVSRRGMINGYFFFAKQASAGNETYGIANAKGKLILMPILDEFDYDGFVNGLIRVRIRGQLAYVNQQGKIVWQEKPDTDKTLRPLNIDFMNRGYFHAYSTPTGSDEDRSGGWAVSNNLPQQFAKNQFPKNQLAIRIDTTTTDTFALKYYGYRVYLSNTTTDTAFFDAQDSRLYMKLQAENAQGNWKDIEYLPGSFCGNSYHELQLEPGACWQFIMPVYEGEIKTRIRIQLSLKNRKNPSVEKMLYSNIIYGSVNPGQFWNKQKYYPKNIMDPYWD
jgi:hypothetical protein